MKTFRYRIRFFVNAKGIIQHPAKKLDFDFSEKIKVQLSSFDANSMNDGKEFVITGAGFSTKEEALELGKKVKDSILVAAAKLRIGADAGKDTSNFYINPTIVKKFFEEKGVGFIQNIHGLSVYEDVKPIKTISSHPPSLVCPSKAEIFLSNVRDFALSSKKLTDKLRLALELYGASHYEKSERARFLTQVLGVESLLVVSKRSEKEQNIVDSLIKSVNESELIDNEKQSLVGSLNWLYYKSISQSLKELARKYIGDKIYNKLSAEKFISKCYNARNMLVHTGAVNENKFNIGSLAAQLDVFLSDLLSAILENDT